MQSPSGRPAASKSRQLTMVALTGGGYLALLALAGLSARPVRSDLAVVLGNAVVAGRPSPRLQARLDVAVALFRAGLVRRVLVSGGVDTAGNDEAAIMAAYLVKAGIPTAAVLQDPLGRDTAATARNTAALRPASVVVVTQWFHVPRATLAMRRAGVANVSAAWPRFAEWRDAYSFGREAVALPVYAVRGVGACGGAATGRSRP